MYSVVALVLLVAVVGLAFWLRRTQLELQTIADYAPSAMAHVVSHGDTLKYRFVNKRYAALYGRQPSDVIGKHPEEILGPDVFARAHANMRRAMAGEIVTFDLDLGDRTVEVVYYPDLPHTGPARGFIGVITDVSELRGLQRKMEREQK